MVSFQREKLSQTIDECLPLFDLHWSEIGPFTDIPFEPALDTYMKLEEAGIVKLFTCRLDDELVGYAVFIVQPSLHHRNSRQAVQDVLFVRKEHRGIGGSFIKWCDSNLKDDGAQVVFHSVMHGHDWSKALTRLGYSQLEQIWVKRLQ